MPVGLTATLWTGCDLCTLRDNTIGLVRARFPAKWEEFRGGQPT